MCSNSKQIDNANEASVCVRACAVVLVKGQLNVWNDSVLASQTDQQLIQLKAKGK